jgi:arylsulfatase A-like enzyme
LTGQAAHNTVSLEHSSTWSITNAVHQNVTDIRPPYGGYTKFIAENLNDNYLPVWLQGAGYNTYYVGKLMNGYSVQTYNDPFPNGFTGSDILVDPGTYEYYNATFVRNREAPVTNEGLYNTDLVANKTYNFIDDAAAAGNPFFLVSTPIGPHSQTTETDSFLPQFGPPEAARRHKDLFMNVTAPRTPNFNPEKVCLLRFIAAYRKRADD